MSASRTTLSVLLPALVLYSAAACVPALARGPFEAVSETAVVEVHNERWEDLTVFVDRRGTLLRIGVVPGLTTRLLEVPDAYLPFGGAIRLSASRTGGGPGPTSEVFSFAPGQRARWVAARTSGPTGVVVR